MIRGTDQVIKHTNPIASFAKGFQTGNNVVKAAENRAQRKRQETQGARPSTYPPSMTPTGSLPATQTADDTRTYAADDASERFVNSVIQNYRRLSSKTPDTNDQYINSLDHELDSQSRRANHA